MSLINEALKKAQRLRNEDTADASAFTEASGTPIVRRGKPDSTQTIVLIGSGALVLVVLSVVATVYLVNRPVNPTVAATATPAPEIQQAPVAPANADETPVIIAPKITAPTASPAPEEAPPLVSVPLTSPSAPAVADVPVSPPTPEETVTAPAAPVTAASVSVAPPPPPPLAPDAPDERVAAFVEAIRVTGIRSLGPNSRVLMNERVYRVNDIVERTLNVRLVKAAADTLTFADSRGVTYVKRF